MAYTENDWRAYELYHHGILGMHWGVQNGPPYPLDSSVSTGKRLKGSGDTVKLSKNEASLASLMVNGMRHVNYTAERIASDIAIHPSKAAKKITAVGKSANKSARALQEAYRKYYDRDSSMDINQAVKGYQKAITKYNKDIDDVTNRLIDKNDKNYESVRRLVEAVAHTEGLNKAYGDWDLAKAWLSYDTNIPEWEFGVLNAALADARTERKRENPIDLQQRQMQIDEFQRQVNRINQQNLDNQNLLNQQIRDVNYQMNQLNDLTTQQALNSIYLHNW